MLDQAKTPDHSQLLLVIVPAVQKLVQAAEK